MNVKTARRIVGHRIDPVLAQIWAEAQRQGYDQARLADTAGLSRSTVSHLLRSTNNPSAETLRLLAAAVGKRLTLADLGEAA